MSGRKGKKTGFYRDKRGKLRWRTVEPGNHIVTGASSQGFTSKRELRDNAILVRDQLEVLILQLSKPSTTIN